jgi:SAM-dependent methyltransferase
MFAAALAHLYDVVMTVLDRIGVAERRRRLVRAATGRVIEIGAGTGLELAHYPPGVRVYAIDPDFEMIQRARSRSKAATAAVTLLVADARALPFRDATFDTAISALAFCTIPDPDRAASEMRRVLRATGAAWLLEHVRARHQALASAQRVLTPVWRRLAGGCHLDRPTADVIARAGFDVDVERSAFDGAVVELSARPKQSPPVDASSALGPNANGTALRVGRPERDK